MEATEVVENVRNCAQIPATESQARPLAKLPAEEQAHGGAQPAPRLPATVQPPPPHFAAGGGSTPFVRRGRTAGGGRRAPRTATEQDRCGSGKVAANESGGASGTRVSLPFPPPFEPPSHPLTFVRTHTRGEGRGKTHGGLLSCYRPPALRGAGLTAAPPHPPCAVAPRGGALVPV